MELFGIQRIEMERESKNNQITMNGMTGMITMILFITLKDYLHIYES